jgi:molybdate transport repressor ModE-like protein
MHKISIDPVWTIRWPDGKALPARLLQLLVHVHEHGSLAAACQASGASYRHAWDLVRQGEALFGMPLLEMERGRGSRLTPLAEKLVWADHRVAARLAPVLQTLASELETEIQRIAVHQPSMVRLHASHGFAVSRLFDLLAEQQVPVDRKYVGSQEAVKALHDGACDVAGFHVPLGEFQAAGFAHYAPWLDPKGHRLVDVATRRQGLIVAKGNPRKIYDVRDLARPGVRFVNRQGGSGTRFLLDCLLQRERIDPASINGYEQAEYTHAAVAAYVASGMADAGFGVEPPARQFKIDFVPVASERYFLLCREPSLSLPQVQAMLEILRSREFRAAVDRLSGYAASDSGRVQTLREAFPGLTGPAPRAKQAAPRKRR